MSKKIVRVKDVMKEDVDTVDGMATVTEALNMMRYAEDTKALIVNKRHDDDEFGIVTLSGISRDVLAQGRAPDRVNIYEIMAKPALTVDPEMDIRYCARMFVRFSLYRAPVVKNGEVIGLVSVNDMVLKGMLSQFD